MDPRGRAGVEPQHGQGEGRRGAGEDGAGASLWSLERVGLQVPRARGWQTGQGVARGDDQEARRGDRRGHRRGRRGHRDDPRAGIGGHVGVG